MHEVTLMQMLEARENRVYMQQTLLQKYSRPLICFTMNIPGPVKNSPLIERSFDWGLQQLDARLPGDRILFREVSRAVTGCQAIYVLDLPAEEIKPVTTAIEDSCPLGRLFDMDVLDERGCKLDREAFGGGSRDCIVCGAPGRGCASRRVHSVSELQQASNALMQTHFSKEG